MTSSGPTNYPEKVGKWNILEPEYKDNLVDGVNELIEKYHTLLERGEADDQSEEDVKIKFLNPLLELLGWRVRGLDEVKFEQRTLSGRTDFGLRTSLDAKPAIFYELKSFDESLDGSRKRQGNKKSYAEIAIQDAWQMKVDWAVLTNFKKLRLYNTHVRDPENGLIFEIDLRDKLDQGEDDEDLGDLWSLAKPRIRQGSLNQYERRRTRPNVTESIVNELEDIRLTLSKDIRQRNDLNEEELRESVQRIMDRLVVIRTAEDREIISPDSLETIVNTWEKTSIDSSFRTLMRDLKGLFRDFDNVYNSKLFAEHPCEDLDISNETLKEVIDKLGYNFDLIDADILGAVYEDYLGHSLQDRGGDVEVVESRETRQQGGIYYTPNSIVEYIGKHTVGEQINDITTPKEMYDFSVVDPACGSGSFLIKAYDYLYTWYNDYNEDVQGDAESDSLGSWEELIDNPENKVVSRNLYGVDLDDQATEIASVNLMLKALRPDEKLPLILGENIKSGNSLVVDNSLENGLNWFGEFDHIFNSGGGFDAVIGNPPWGADTSNYDDYLQTDDHYHLSTGQYDSYELFIELSLEILRDGGRMGFVIPDSIFLEEHEPLRELLAEKTKIEKIIDLGEGFFDVYRAATIAIITNSVPEENTDHTIDAFEVRKEDRENIKNGVKTLSEVEREKVIEIPQARVLNSEDYSLDITSQVDEEIIEVLEENPIDWSELFISGRGVELSQDGDIVKCPNCLKWTSEPTTSDGEYTTKDCENCPEEFEYEEAMDYDTIVSASKQSDAYEQFALGESINRYRLTEPQYMDVTRDGINYKDKSLYDGAKIMVRKTGVGLYATLDYDMTYAPQVVYIFNFKNKSERTEEWKNYDPEYVLGVLNSRLMLYYYVKEIGDSEWKSFPYVTLGNIRSLPVRRINWDDEEEVRIHNEISEKVTELMENAEKDHIPQTLDNEIERLVLDLYDINAEQRKYIWKELKDVQDLRIIREVMHGDFD